MASTKKKSTRAKLDVDAVERSNGDALAAMLMGVVDALRDESSKRGGDPLLTDVARCVAACATATAKGDALRETHRKAIARMALAAQRVAPRVLGLGPPARSARPKVIGALRTGATLAIRSKAPAALVAGAMTAVAFDAFPNVATKDAATAERWLRTKLEYEAARDGKIDADRLVVWALQAAGVKRGDAWNWLKGGRDVTPAAAAAIERAARARGM